METSKEEKLPKEIIQDLKKNWLKKFALIMVLSNTLTFMLFGHTQTGPKQKDELISPPGHVLLEFNVISPLTRNQIIESNLSVYLLNEKSNQLIAPKVYIHEHAPLANDSTHFYHQSSHNKSRVVASVPKSKLKYFIPNLGKVFTLLPYGHRPDEKIKEVTEIRRSYEVHL